MIDDELAALETRWRQSGDREDLARYARAKQRAGDTVWTVILALDPWEHYKKADTQVAQLATVALEPPEGVTIATPYPRVRIAIAQAATRGGIPRVIRGPTTISGLTRIPLGPTFDTLEHGDRVIVEQTALSLPDLVASVGCSFFPEDGAMPVGYTIRRDEAARVTELEIDLEGPPMVPQFRPVVVGGGRPDAMMAVPGRLTETKIGLRFSDDHRDFDSMSEDSYHGAMIDRVHRELLAAGVQEDISWEFTTRLVLVTSRGLEPGQAVTVTDLQVSHLSRPPPEFRGESR